MNDFTKDELQIIHLDMTVYVNRTPMLKESPIHKELRDKIQSLIENYCEHEFHPVIGSFQIDSCHKCMKVK